MKKVLFVLAVAGFFAACGGATETGTESAVESATVESATVESATVESATVESATQAE